MSSSEKIFGRFAGVGITFQPLVYAFCGGLLNRCGNISLAAEVVDCKSRVLWKLRLDSMLLVDLTGQFNVIFICIIIPLKRAFGFAVQWLGVAQGVLHRKEA